MALHFTGRTHMLDGRIRLVGPAADGDNFLGSDFTLAIQILIIERKPGSSLQNAS
jgi:hypothetical protein